MSIYPLVDWLDSIANEFGLTIIAAGPYVRLSLPPELHTMHWSPYLTRGKLKYTKTKQSQAVKANGQIFVSGQIPADAAGSLVEGSIGEKTQACCNNIKAILEAAGSSVEKIVKVNVCPLPFILFYFHFFLEGSFGLGGAGGSYWLGFI